MTTSYDYNHFINGHPPDDELVRLALTDMQKSGLSAASLEEAKVIIFNGNHQELNKKLGFTSLNGHSFLGNGKLVIEIPYFNEDGSVSLYRYKLIPSIENGNGEKVKYLHPKGKPAIPYILPKVRAVKDKRNKPLCITEGEKKASKLIQHGMAAIALPGVWSFKAGKDNQDEESKYIWSDLLKFRLDGRTVFLAFDSDLWTNPNVRAALYELAFKLKAKGALVRFVKWPASQGKGIDDYLTNNQDPGKELSKLEEAALDINDDGALPFDHKPAILRAYIMAKPGMSKGTKEWFILVLSQAWGIAKETIELEISDIEKKISPSIEWEDPIPFNDYSSLPDFPLDGMPSLEQEIVKIGSEVLQIDSGILSNIALSNLSTSVSKKAVVDLITHQEPLNLYMAGIAESGERKSQAMRTFTGSILSYQSEQQRKLSPFIKDASNAFKILEQRLNNLQTKAAKTENEQERQEIIQKANEVLLEMENKPVPKLPRYIADDITAEKLGPLMVENAERISIYSAEGHIFSIMAGRYSDKAVNIDLFLKSHAGDFWGVDRIGRESLVMQNPALTICLTVQPDIIEDVGTVKQFRGQGLLARFLYSWSKSRVGYRERQTEKIPETLLERYQQHITALMNISLPSEPHVLTLSKDAQDLWDEFYNDVEREMKPGGALEYLKDWGSKLPGAVARIAGLLHFAEYGADAINKPIPLSIVSSACAIGAYYQVHAIATFGYMQTDPRIKAAKSILDYITSHKVKSFKGRDVLANKNVFKYMADIVPGIENLIERNYIREQRIDKKPTPGRPEAVLYLVNPEINIFKNHQQ